MQMLHDPRFMILFLVGFVVSYMSLVTRKPVFRVCDQVGLNWPAQIHKRARVVELQIKKLEILYYRGSEKQRC